MRPRFLFRASLLLSILALISPEVFAEDGNYGEHYATVPIAFGLDKDGVRESIVVTFTGRAWTVREKGDTHVIGYLNHRGIEATTTMTYDAENVVIYCEGWALRRSGERAKREQPSGWLENLRQDLIKHMQTRAATG